MKFLVGIGGIGMSALARFLKAQGEEVMGSDRQASELTEALESEGISVRIGHDEVLPQQVDELIFSEAIPVDNPERREAAARGISCLNYFEALGRATQGYRLVALAGTHGKTTTTAMLGLILERAGLDPTVLVGSTVPQFDGKNLRVGQGELFVVEACEYRRNFLPLRPALLGVLNMELDHVDYFKGEADYRRAFETLAEQSGDVLWPEDYAPYEGELGVPGHHNRQNAGMAAELARRLGVSEAVIAESLMGFKGTWRRFEYCGEWKGAPIYDDYAHHPSEVQATLQAARERHPERRVVAVFQPHQHSRARHFLEAFSQAFEGANEVFIPNIYAARDSQEDREAMSAEDFVAALSQHHPSVHYGGGLESTAEMLKNSIGPKDVVLVMGAGNVRTLLDFWF